MDRAFEQYEQVAAFLLNEFAVYFGLDHVEGKQIVSGHKSGATWEIDGKGIRDSDGAIVIIECRRYVGSRPNQEQLAALAYRVKDTGAVGGIIVTPIGIQKGAEKVALAEKIISVQLDSESTTSDYVLRFLKKMMIGSSLPLSGSVDMKVSASLTRQCEMCCQQFFCNSDGIALPSLYQREITWQVRTSETKEVLEGNGNRCQKPFSTRNQKKHIELLGGEGSVG